MSEVARAHNMKVSDFVKALQDKDLGYDKNEDKIVYADAGLLSAGSADAPGAPPAAAAVAEAAGATAVGGGSAAPGGADPVDVSLAFTLHSRPSATKKLLLDFTGHATTGTVWNTRFGPTITTPPYDTDGNPAAFSDTELRNIIFMWRQVAEDYAPFDVSVRLQPASTGAQPAANTPARHLPGAPREVWELPTKARTHPHAPHPYQNITQSNFCLFLLCRWMSPPRKTTPPATLSVWPASARAPSSAALVGTGTARLSQARRMPARLARRTTIPPSSLR